MVVVELVMMGAADGAGVGDGGSGRGWRLFCEDQPMESAPPVKHI